MCRHALRNHNGLRIALRPSAQDPNCTADNPDPAPRYARLAKPTHTRKRHCPRAIDIVTQARSARPCWKPLSTELHSVLRSISRSTQQTSPGVGWGATSRGP